MVCMDAKQIRIHFPIHFKIKSMYLLLLSVLSPQLSSKARVNRSGGDKCVECSSRWRPPARDRGYIQTPAIGRSKGNPGINSEAKHYKEGIAIL